MARSAKTPTPFFYQSAWYVKFAADNGKKTLIQTGTPEEKAAYKKAKSGKGIPVPQAVIDELHGMLALSNAATDGADMLIATLCQHYLADLQRVVSPKSFENTACALNNLCNKGFDTLTVAEFKPLHISQWLGLNPQWKSANSIRRNVKSVKAALNWGVNQGYFSTNPVGGKKVSLPPAISRQYLMTAEDIKAIRENSAPAFVAFFNALLCLGCRPGELAQATASDVIVNGGRLIIRLLPENWKCGKKTGKARLIYIPDGMTAEIRRLMAQNPTGTLYRTPQNHAWNQDRWIYFVDVLHEKELIPAELTLYSVRHWWITNALENGVSIETVAEMCGTSATVIQKTYSHLSQKPDLMFAALAKIQIAASV